MMMMASMAVIRLFWKCQYYIREKSAGLIKANNYRLCIMFIGHTYTLGPIWNSVGDLCVEHITAVTLHGASLWLVASDDTFLSTCWTLGLVFPKEVLNADFAELVIAFVEVLGIGVWALADVACIANGQTSGDGNGLLWLLCCTWCLRRWRRLGSWWCNTRWW